MVKTKMTTNQKFMIAALILISVTGAILMIIGADKQQPFIFIAGETCYVGIMAFCLFFIVYINIDSRIRKLETKEKLDVNDLKLKVRR